VEYVVTLKEEKGSHMKRIFKELERKIQRQRKEKAGR
jgi:hypothetical protein